MPRKKTVIYADVAPISSGGTEADMQFWVRVTQMLLRARAQREARLAPEGLSAGAAGKPAEYGGGSLGKTDVLGTCKNPR